MNNYEFAIQMEIDGMNYYLEQAEFYKGNELEKVFKMLAEDEKKHAELVKTYLQAKELVLSDGTETEWKGVFDDIGVFKVKDKEIPAQIDAYQFAKGKEEKSIELYKKMQAEVKDEAGRELFDYLIRQEEYHYRLLNDLVEHLRKAEDWVEDAEFGKRETY